MLCQPQMGSIEINPGIYFGVTLKQLIFIDTAFNRATIAHP
jgi:hypothetical protein